MPDTTTTTPLDALAALAAETIRLDPPPGPFKVIAERHGYTVRTTAACQPGDYPGEVIARVKRTQDAYVIAGSLRVAPTLARALTALLPALKEWREALGDLGAHPSDADRALLASIDTLGTGAGAAGAS